MRTLLPALLIVPIVGCSWTAEENGAPTGLAIAIAPEAPGTNEPLQVVFVQDAVDDDAVNYRYRWLRDGAVVDGLESARVDPLETSPGEAWTVVVTPTDGRLDGTAASASVVVGNSAPVVTGVQVTPDPPQPGVDLMCQHDEPTDADGDDISLAFIWEVDGVGAVSDTDTLPSGLFVKDEVIRCGVTATDANGLTAATV